MTSKTTNKFSPEVRERAVRLDEVECRFVGEARQRMSDIDLTP